MEILALPFFILLLWALFFFIFIAKKAAEGETKKSVNTFWYKFFGFGIGAGFLAKYIFYLVSSSNVLPQIIQDSILPKIGFAIGLMIGVVYVLVSHEKEN